MQTRTNTNPLILNFKGLRKSKNEKQTVHVMYDSENQIAMYMGGSNTSNGGPTTSQKSHKRTEVSTNGDPRCFKVENDAPVMTDD